MLISNLALGPMSKEIIEAVYRHSQKYGKQLMLISSRNQIERYDGYVFTTEKYLDYIELMIRKYKRANVILCRDHCGPGFGTPEDTIESVMETIQCDIEFGFDLIHIDLCHMDVSHKEKISQTMDLMRFARSIRHDIIFEIGTDENVGVTETNVDRIIADVTACQQIPNLEFYVVQTGSLIWENYQSGSFDRDKVEKMHDALSDLGVKLKEHNADYLNSTQIRSRHGVVDAINIAPQLGVVQTNYVLSQALIYGVDTKRFVNEVFDGERWKKWTDKWKNKHLSVLLGGHYHFNGSAYKEIVDKISKQATFSVREGIINEITKVIEHYHCAWEGV